MFHHEQVIDFMGRKFFVHAVNQSYDRFSDGARMTLDLREVVGWTEPAFMCESDDFGCGKCRSQCEPCRKAG